MAGKLEGLIPYLPTPIKTIAVNSFAILWKNKRFGSTFHKAWPQFVARDSYTRNEWHSYQEKNLRKLLIHAFETVPYYHNTFRERGFDKGYLKSFKLEELPLLPVVTKENFRSHPESFLSSITPRNSLYSLSSSGTTGTPLKIWCTREVHALFNAVREARSRRWAGIDFHNSRAMVGGRIIVPPNQTAPPFWVYNYFERQLYFSAFHISPANIPYYVEALNKYKPDYLEGYASAHFFLARMIGELGLAVYKPKCIITSSEKLTDEMRKTIESIYKARVFNEYGNVEGCCFASECPAGCLHISPDVGIIEIICEDGMYAADGEIGEIVATGLLNSHQPLIRYRTGDLAIVSRGDCACGRQMPVLKDIVGRLEDVVIGVDGRETVRFHGLFYDIPYIREGQVIQEDYNHIRILLVLTKQLTDKQEKIIKSRVKERMGGTVQVDLEAVDRIPRTERGKFRAVISKVSR